MRKIDNLKIGEKVVIRSWEDMVEEFESCDGYINTSGAIFDRKMEPYCGQKVTITSIIPNYGKEPYYKIEEDFGCYNWSKEMFENWKNMTNREWLENLSDEELADFLLKSTTNCHNVCSSSECGIAYKCIDGVRMWLQSKHEE